MIWLLGGYMWLYVHRPFEVWPVLGTLRIERVYMIVTLLYWIFFSERHWIKNRLTAALGCLAAVVLLSDLLSPFGMAITTIAEDWLKVLVFYVLVISTVRTERDLQMLIVMFIAAMGLSLCHSMREYLGGRHVYRMGVARMIGVGGSYSDPNSFAASILYSLPLLWPLWKASREQWHRGLLTGYLALAVTCIMLTGSRSGLVGLGCLAIAVAWLFRSRFALIVLVLLALPTAWGALRPDLQKRFLTLVDPSQGPKSAEASAESRSRGWYDGVRIWNEHPLLGVGAGNFGRGRGYELQSHQLYGQVLGELGTLGAIAFAMLIAGFAANWREFARLCRGQPELRDGFPVRLANAIMLTVVLLLIMGFGGHNLFRYTWVWYAAFQAIALQLTLAQSRDGFAVKHEVEPEPALLTMIRS